MGLNSDAGPIGHNCAPYVSKFSNLLTHVLFVARLPDPVTPYGTVFPYSTLVAVLLENLKASPAPLPHTENGNNGIVAVGAGQLGDSCRYALGEPTS